MRKPHLIALALACTAVLASAPPASADVNRQGDKSLQLPVAGTVGGGGGTFSGTFILKQFAVRNGVVVAIGIVRGTVTSAAGIVLGTALVAPVELPVTVGPRPAAAAGSPALLQQSCPVLNVALGAINIDLLGVQVALIPIEIDLTATSEAATDALGRLICTVLETVGNVTGLANALNQLLAVLGGMAPAV